MYATTISKTNYGSFYTSELGVAHLQTQPNIFCFLYV